MTWEMNALSLFSLSKRWRTHAHSSCPLHSRNTHLHIRVFSMSCSGSWMQELSAFTGDRITILSLAWYVITKRKGYTHMLDIACVYICVYTCTYWDGEREVSSRRVGVNQTVLISCQVAARVFHYRKNPVRQRCSADTTPLSVFGEDLYLQYPIMTDSSGHLYFIVGDHQV